MDGCGYDYEGKGWRLGKRKERKGKEGYIGIVIMLSGLFPRDEHLVPFRFDGLGDFGCISLTPRV